MDPGSAKPLRHWAVTLVIGHKPLWTLTRVAVLVVATILLHTYVLLLRKIESTSMLPTFREGSVHVINRLAYRHHPPARGDIVAVRTSGETVMYIKRIIGLPGETIAIRHGVILVNQQPLEEPYVRLPRRPDWERSPLKLRPDEYYLIGDNRSMAKDQHEFGRVDGQRILGKVVW